MPESLDGSSCKAPPDQRVVGMTSNSKDEAPLWLSDIKEVAVIPEECNDNVVKVTKQGTERLPVWRDLLLHPTLSVRHMLICVLGSTSSNKHVASTPSSSIAPLRLSDIKEVAGIPKECNDDVVKLTKQSTRTTAPLRLSDIKEVAGIPKECNDDVVKLTKQRTRRACGRISSFT